MAEKHLPFGEREEQAFTAALSDWAQLKEVSEKIQEFDELTTRFRKTQSEYLQMRSSY